MYLLLYSVCYGRLCQRITMTQTLETDRMVTRQYKKIKMCHVNIQSLGRSDQGNTSNANVKLDQIRAVLQLEDQLEVIGISEIWLTPAVADDGIALQDCRVYRKDRTDRGGGVCCYIKTSIETFSWRLNL